MSVATSVKGVDWVVPDGVEYGFLVFDVVLGQVFGISLCRIGRR